MNESPILPSEVSERGVKSEHARAINMLIRAMRRNTIRSTESIKLRVGPDGTFPSVTGSGLGTEQDTNLPRWL